MKNILGKWLLPILFFLAPIFCYAEEVSTVSEAIKSLATQISAKFSAKEGRVAAVNNEDVYINIGFNDRVKEGDKFEIVRHTEDIKDADGNKIGAVEQFIGFIQIEKIRGAKLSIGRLVEKGETVQAGDVVVSVSKKTRVALTPFDGTNLNKITLSKVLPEMLSVELTMSGEFEVAERAQLDKVLKELEMSRSSGLMEPDSIKEIGKMLGVEGVIVGSLTELEKHVAISAKLIDAETGLVFSAAQVNLKKDAAVQEMLKKNDLEAINGNVSVVESQLIEQFRSDFNLFEKESSYVLLGKADIRPVLAKIANPQSILAGMAVGKVGPTDRNYLVLYCWGGIQNPSPTQPLGGTVTKGLYTFILSNNFIVQAQEFSITSSDTNIEPAYTVNESGSMHAYGPSASTISISSQSAIMGYRGFPFPDLNGDGKEDIVAFTNLRNIRIGNWESMSTYSQSYAFGDLNCNGRQEIYIATGNKVKVIEWEPAMGTYLELWTSKPLGSEIGRLAVGDVNNDGRDELIIEVRDGFQKFLYFAAIQ